MKRKRPNNKNVIKGAAGVRVGAPRIWEDCEAEEFADAVNSYLDSCWEEVQIYDSEGKKTGKTEMTQTRPYTRAGLAVHLRISRETLKEWSTTRPKLSGAIKAAYEVIASQVEELCITEGKAGQIFIAKNNGYTDQVNIKSESEVKMDMNVAVNTPLEDRISKLKGSEE